MHEERRERREFRRDPSDREDFGREDFGREDFGQADFSSDYGYDPERRVGYRAEDEGDRRAEDYGQADYAADHPDDAERGRGYRRFSEDDRDYGYGAAEDRDRIYGREMGRSETYRRGEPPRYYERDPREGRRDWDERDTAAGERSRSWMSRAGAFFTGRDEGEAARRRRGPSDRVLWAVIVERLEDERGLDLRDVEVLVEDAEVTLNGTVRRKDEKRRIEDIADIDGVRHVQNNLRVRERRWF
jgi:osmotically-inducible protein OsmY